MRYNKGFLFYPGVELTEHNVMMVIRLNVHILRADDAPQAFANALCVGPSTRHD